MNSLQHKKIMLVTSALHGGGAERIFRWLAWMLAKSGAELRIFSFCGKPDEADMPVPVEILGWRSEYDYPRIIRDLRREIRDFRPDLVVSWAFLTNLVCAIACRLSGTDAVPVLNERSRVSQLLGDSGWFRKTILGLAVRWCYRRAERVLCNSNSACLDLSRSFGIPESRLAAVPNPVDINGVMSAAVDCPPEFADAPRPIHVCVGRLSPEKGQLDALQGWLALAEYQRGSLFFVGDGPDREKLAGAIADSNCGTRVHLLGAKQNPYPYMHHADTMILSSYYEGFPNVLLEGIAVQTVVVVTESCDNVVELAAAGCCLSSPVGDASALTDRLHLAQHPDIRAGIRKQCAQVITGYAPEAVAGIYTQQFLIALEPYEGACGK